MTSRTVTEVVCDLCGATIAGEPALRLPLSLTYRSTYLHVCADCSTRPIADLSAALEAGRLS